jgi:hypothetical protein
VANDESANRSGGRISPISLQKHLKGTVYPASRDDLVRQARGNQAPADVLALLHTLPGERFSGPRDVMRAFGQAT